MTDTPHAGNCHCSLCMAAFEAYMRNKGMRGHMTDTAMEIDPLEEAIARTLSCHLWATIVMGNNADCDEFDAMPEYIKGIYRKAAAAVIARHIPQSGEWADRHTSTSISMVQMGMARDAALEQVAQLEARCEKLAGLLYRMCDAYEPVCSDTGKNYHHSPTSVYASARQALEKDAS